MASIILDKLGTLVQFNTSASPNLYAKQWFLGLDETSAYSITVNSPTSAVSTFHLQDLGVSATPTFNGMTLSNITGSKILVSNGSKGIAELTTLTPSGFLYASNTGSIASTTSAADGQLLIGRTGNIPLATTLSGTTNRLDITNASGSITINISTNYIGQTSITTLGTITTGVWNGTSISVAKGGTGLTTLGAPGQFIGIDAGQTGFEYKNLIGTVNQITITSGAGTYTFSLAQSIATTSTPTFAGLTITNYSGYIKGSASGVLSAVNISTSDVVEGTNLYYTTLRVDNEVSAFVQNSTSLFWNLTNGLYKGTVSLSAFSTSNLSEGTNLYWTSARTRFSVSGTANQISYNTSTGVFGIDVAYIGQTSITTVGTLTAGTWNGSVIGTTYGGTGLASLGSANQFLRVNGAGSALNYSALSSSDVTTALGYTPVNRAGDTMVGFLTLNADPTNALHAATMQYVNQVAVGLKDFKDSVRVATTGSHITLSAAPNTLDGITLSANDRVLVRNQSGSEQNGIYTILTLGTGSNGVWLRSYDTSAQGDISTGTYVAVEQGNTWSLTSWIVSTTGLINIGTTGITWVFYGGVSTITAGAGLVLTNATLNVATASSSRIVVNADSIDLATTSVVAGVYTRVTVDAYGRITSGGDIRGTSNVISFSDGAINIDAAYVGQSSITTLGTITTGTWNASVIHPKYGGTGLSTSGTANQLLGANSTGTGTEWKTISAGSNITISNTAGFITIASSTGFGGYNQNVDTSAAPTFTGATFTGLTASRLVITNGTSGLASNAALAVNCLVYATGTGSLASFTSATNGQILIGQTSAAPIWSNITGTSNQITVTNNPGGIILSLPQSIATASSVTFANTTLSNSLIFNTYISNPSPSNNNAAVYLYNNGSAGELRCAITDGSGNVTTYRLDLTAL